MERRCSICAPPKTLRLSETMKSADKPGEVHGKEQQQEGAEVAKRIHTTVGWRDAAGRAKKKRERKRVEGGAPSIQPRMLDAKASRVWMPSTMKIKVLAKKMTMCQKWSMKCCTSGLPGRTWTALELISGVSSAPATWQKKKLFIAFICHLTREKSQIGRPQVRWTVVQHHVARCQGGCILQ